MQHTSRIGLALCLVLGSVVAGADEPPPWLWSGPAAGSWRQDSSGTWRGRGQNFGQSWRQDATGAWRGGGRAFGQAWRQDSSGTWNATGRPWGASQMPGQPRSSPARQPPTDEGVVSP